MHSVSTCPFQSACCFQLFFELYMFFSSVFEFVRCISTFPLKSEHSVSNVSLTLYFFTNFLYICIFFPNIPLICTVFSQLFSDVHFFPNVPVSCKLHMFFSKCSCIFHIVSKLCLNVYILFPNFPLEFYMFSLHFPLNMYILFPINIVPLICALFLNFSLDLYMVFSKVRFKLYMFSPNIPLLFILFLNVALNLYIFLQIPLKFVHFASQLVDLFLTISCNLYIVFPTVLARYRSYIVHFSTIYSLVLF